MFITLVLRVRPDTQVIIKSLCSVTAKIPTKRPIFSLTLIVFTPLPPRLVILYSFKFVLLPNPLSLTTITVLSVESVSIQIIPTTSSFESSTSMPRTPIAPRPVNLTLDSGNRIARPERKAIIISCLPLVNLTSKSSSPSLIVMAIIPFVRGRLKSSNKVFLIIPFFVQNIK